MTIPIQLPQIGTTGIAPRQPSIFELAAPILEAIAQQKVAQAQLQSVRALTEQRRLEAAKLAQDTQDQADAAKAFYNHVSGAATRVKPEKPAADGTPSPQGIDNTTGMLMPLPQFERSLSPQAHKLYMDMLSGHNATIQQSLTGAETQVRGQHEAALTDVARLEAIKAQKAAADDAATQQILGASDLTTDVGQRQAIRKVIQTVGPEAGNQLARTLNTGLGRYGHVVGPDGYLYITDSKTGAVRRDTVVGQREGVGQVRLEAIKRSAGTIVDLLDAQNEIVKGTGIQGSKNPVLAQMLQDARVLGLPTEAAANLFRSDPQQATQMLKTRFVHNYIGMLANARASTPILQNLGESYWPVGVSDAVLRRAQRDREKLRAIMVGVRDGKITDLNRIPGFSASVAAAASEGRNIPAAGEVPTTPPNPDEWATGVPPQVPPQ